VARFDAERYLRIVGERMVLATGDGRGRGPWESPLAAPASALVAIGAINPTKAVAVIDDYALAEALRSEDGHHRLRAHAHRPRRRRTKPLRERRVFRCDRTVELADGTLHVRRVTLAQNVTSLAVRWRPSQGNLAGSRHRRQMGAYGPGAASGPPHPQLRDERGTTVGAVFHGSGEDEEWTGHLTAHRPLAPETRWLEIDGNRIELTNNGVPCEISVEALTDEPAPLRYLWHRLATAGRFHGLDGLEGAMAALVAAGALNADDPVLDEVRRVRDSLPQHPGMHAPSRGGRRLPEPWRSALARLGRQDGPEGSIVLSGLTPEFDGFTVALGSLDSEPEGFAVEADLAPGLEAHIPFGQGLGSTSLAWWAVDDRENHYLGQLGSSGGGEDYQTVEINFWSALDPKARRLALMPTAEASRAVIAFPLEWE
jgi:hypothetical protein